MEETMVPNQEPVEEDGLFDDYTEEESVTEETPVEEEQPQEEVQSEGSNEPFLNIQYNKENVGLTREEAIEYAQKGKNYDKVNEKYHSLYDNLDRMAKANGQNVDEFMSFLGETQKQYAVDKKVEFYKEKYPDSPDELLRELAEKDVAQEQGKALDVERLKAEEEKNAQEEEAKRQWALFEREYPDVDPDSLDKSVYDMVRDGYTLLEAYGRYQRIEANKPEAKAQKLNEENQARSYGSTTNTGNVEADDFLAGWNED